MTQYRRHIITDPRIYLNEDKKQFKIGTVEEAKANKWHSWDELLTEYKSQ